MMTADEKGQYDRDLSTVHYQAARSTTFCGAIGRVIDLIKAEKITERDEKGKYRVMLVQTITDIRRVTCPACQYKIKKYVEQNW